jgi:hypothetical protein
MLRRIWQNGGLCLGLLLPSGCLYHATAPVELPQNTQAVQVVQPPAARIAASLEPQPTPPQVEMGPALSSPPQLPAISLPAAPEPPAPPEAPLVTAWRKVLEHRPGEAERALRRVSDPRRSQVLSLMKLTAVVGEGEMEQMSPGEAEALLEGLQSVEEGLKERASLQLRSVRYCRGIKGFGQYEPAGEAPAFRAGASGHHGERVQVYAEVRRFRSKEVDGQHETRLSAAAEVRSRDGKTVARIPLGACKDCSRSQRTDYFLNCQMHVPAGLEPGEYILWLTVRDLTDGKGREARASLPFHVQG